MPFPTRLSRRVFQRNFTVWRKHAVASAVGNFLDPLFYLVVLGMGLGRVVELGRLQLDGLPLLDDASLAPGLRAVDTLSLTDLPKLTDLPSWPDLALVDRWIVRDVDAIRALPDLPDLSRVKELVITRNDRLEEIGGLATNRTSSPTFYGVQITDRNKVERRAVPPGHVRFASSGARPAMMCAESPCSGSSGARISGSRDSRSASCSATFAPAVSPAAWYASRKRTQ